MAMLCRYAMARSKEELRKCQDKMTLLEEQHKAHAKTMVTRLEHRRSLPNREPQYDSGFSDDYDRKRRWSISQTMASCLTKLLLAARRILPQHLRAGPKIVSFLAILALLFITSRHIINLLSSSITVATSSFEKRPVIVQSLFPRQALPLSLVNEPPQFIKERENRYWINHGDFYHRSVTPQFENKTVCQPLEKWQEERNLGLTCLDFHAIYMADNVDVQLVGEGGFMNAWRFEEYNGKYLILKTIRWTNDMNFNHVNYEDFRKDALVASTLTASPYVADFYGFCSHSSIAEYSQGGILWWIFKGKKQHTKNELLQIAHDVSAGVNDAHHVSSTCVYFS